MLLNHILKIFEKTDWNSLGYGMIYLPSVVMLNQYFEKRRSFAVGIAVSGAGIGTFAFSPLIKSLIDIYSWKGTMLILSGVTLNCVVCVALYRPLTKVRKNMNPRSLSGKSSKSDSITVDTEKLTPDSKCIGIASIAFPERRIVPELHFNETSIGLTVDNVDKVYTISSGNYNTFSGQDYHLTCPKIEGTPVDVLDRYSETILVDDLKKSNNTSLSSCNMPAARQAVPLESVANQQDVKNKEINKGFNQLTLNSNNSQEDIYIPGTAAILQPITVLPDVTRDKSNRNHSNQNRTSLYCNSSKPYVNAMDQDNPHFMDDNSHQALPLQLLKSNQTFGGEKQSNDDELEPRSKSLVSQVLGENRANEVTSVSPLDNAESHSKNYEEPLVLCRCLTLSAKHAEELRSVFHVSIIKNKKFVIFSVSHMFYAFGYYIPYVYLPVYAESIGIDTDLTAWIISALGIASTVSRVISGFLSDLPNVNRLFLYSAALVICGVASSLVPLCDSFPLLMAYACVLGAFSGVTLTLISVLLVDLVGIDLLSEAFGIIGLVEGVTSLVGPPIAGWLFDQTRRYTITFIMTGIAIACHKPNRDQVSSVMARRSTSTLPPDGGWGWMIVFGTFMVHFILDGIFYSFGILFAEFVDYFHGSKSETSLVVSLAMGIPFLIGPFASILTNIFGSRKVMIGGTLVLASGFILTIFTPNLYFMYFSLGILAGFGYGMIFLPAIVLVNQYFEKRRSFAVGIAASGTGIGTFAFSPLIKTLIDIYSWKGTMLILSGVFLNCAVFGALFRPLTNLRKNKNHTAFSGKSSKGSSVIIDPEKQTPDIASKGNAFITFPKKKRVSVQHSDETTNDITLDDLDKVDTISLNSYNTFFGQDHHLVCPKKTQTPGDRSDELSDAIPMEGLDNTSLNNCNMSSVRQDGAKQIDTKKKEIDRSTKKCVHDSNHSDDEDVDSPGAAVMSQQKRFLPDETRDQSNRNNSNQSGQSIDKRSSQSCVNSIARDNLHSVNQDNCHLEAAHKLLNMNQTSNAAEECEGDELEPQAKESFSQLLDEDKTVNTTVSPLDKSESDSNNQDEPLVLCRCLTLSPQNAKELRSAFQISLMKDSGFLIFLISYMLYGLGYYVPYVYLPVYAESVGIDIDLAAWTISAAGIANTIGRVIFGFLSDLPCVNRLYLYSAAVVICGVASTLIPLCDSFPLLMAYACIFGAFSGVTITLTSVVLVDLVGIDLLSEAFGISNMVAGVTSLSGPPLAGWLFDETESYTISFIMTGIAIAVSGLILFIIPCIQKRRRQRKE
ncbi:hypothetical protein CHS0354_007201 [Potamilus streckersoni]|uniref:Major facilitator superfamily (MFS) profile domain-containing protein n=1 Tax=Potamilus streckersoni TaxID=2493646 RepID=A0AAE0T7K9_9BIVA|nr:hypothetical protein CHS0354_007201 [Potamilus streckersoni]